MIVQDNRDEDIDPFLKKYLNLNLRGPMPGCDPKHRRVIILQGDLRMKDNFDPRVSKTNVVLLFLFFHYINYLIAYESFKFM